MAIEASDELGRFLKVLTGEDFPVANEDRLFGLATSYDDAAQGIHDSIPLLAAGLNTVSAGVEGNAQQAFADSMQDYVNDEPGYLTVAAKYVRRIGQNHHDLGTQVQYAKLMIIACLIELLIEFTVAMAFAFFNPAAALQTIARGRIIMNFLMRTVLRRILTSVVTAAVVGISMQVLMDLIVQRLQIAMGTRDHIDPDLVRQAAVVGALGAAVGLGLGGIMHGLAHGFGKYIKPKISSPKPATPKPSVPEPTPATTSAVPKPAPTSAAPKPEPKVTDHPNWKVDEETGDVTFVRDPVTLEHYAHEMTHEALTEYLTEGLYSVSQGQGWNVDWGAAVSGIVSAAVSQSGTHVGTVLGNKFGPAYKVPDVVVAAAAPHVVPAPAPVDVPPVTSIADPPAAESADGPSPVVITHTADPVVTANSGTPVHNSTVAGAQSNGPQQTETTATNTTNTTNTTATNTAATNTAATNTATTVTGGGQQQTDVTAGAADTHLAQAAPAPVGSSPAQVASAPAAPVSSWSPAPANSAPISTPVTTSPVTTTPVAPTPVATGPTSVPAPVSATGPSTATTGPVTSSTSTPVSSSPDAAPVTARTTPTLAQPGATSAPTPVKVGDGPASAPTPGKVGDGTTSAATPVRGGDVAPAPRGFDLDQLVGAPVTGQAGREALNQWRTDSADWHPRSAALRRIDDAVTAARGGRAGAEEIVAAIDAWRATKGDNGSRRSPAVDRLYEAVRTDLTPADEQTNPEQISPGRTGAERIGPEQTGPVFTAPDLAEPVSPGRARIPIHPDGDSLFEAVLISAYAQGVTMPPGMPAPGPASRGADLRSVLSDRITQADVDALAGPRPDVDALVTELLGPGRADILAGEVPGNRELRIKTITVEDKLDTYRIGPGARGLFRDRAAGVAISDLELMRRALLHEDLWSPLRTDVLDLLSGGLALDIVVHDAATGQVVQHLGRGGPQVHVSRDGADGYGAYGPVTTARPDTMPGAPTRDWVNDGRTTEWRAGLANNAKRSAVAGLRALDLPGRSLLYLGGDADVDHALAGTGADRFVFVGRDPATSAADAAADLKAKRHELARALAAYVRPGYLMTAAAPAGPHPGFRYQVTDAGTGQVVFTVEYHHVGYQEFLAAASETFPLVMDKDSWLGEDSGVSTDPAVTLSRVGNIVTPGGHWFGNYGRGVQEITALGAGATVLTELTVTGPGEHPAYGDGTLVLLHRPGADVLTEGDFRAAEPSWLKYVTNLAQGDLGAHPLGAGLEPAPTLRHNLDWAVGRIRNELWETVVEQTDETPQGIGDAVEHMIRAVTELSAAQGESFGHPQWSDGLRDRVAAEFANKGMSRPAEPASAPGGLVSDGTVAGPSPARSMIGAAWDAVRAAFGPQRLARLWDLLARPAVAPARPVTAEEVVVARDYPWLPQVNPYREAGGEFLTNCVLTAITTDIALAEGEGFQAPPSHATPARDLLNYQGQDPISVRDFAAVRDLVGAAPVGARGIVVIRERDRGVGHAFNVVHNRDGVVFLDGQSGRVADVTLRPYEMVVIPTAGLTPGPRTAGGFDGGQPVGMRQLTIDPVDNERRDDSGPRSPRPAEPGAPRPVPAPPPGREATKRVRIIAQRWAAVNGRGAEVARTLRAWVELEENGLVDEVAFVAATDAVLRAVDGLTGVHAGAARLRADVLRERYATTWHDDPYAREDDELVTRRVRSGVRAPGDVDAIVAARGPGVLAPAPVRASTRAETVHVIQAHFSGEVPIHAAAVLLDPQMNSHVVIEHDLTWFLDERRKLERDDLLPPTAAAELVTQGAAKAERLSKELIALGVPADRITLREVFDVEGTGAKRMVSETHKSVAARFHENEPAARARLRQGILLDRVDEDRRIELRAAVRKLLDRPETPDGRPIALIWVRRSGLSPGGAYPELDMFDGMLDQLVEVAADPAGLGARVILVGDDPGKSFAATHSELVGGGLIEFWKNKALWETDGGALSRAEQLVVFDLLSEQPGTVAIGMESGAIELPALLGLDTVYLEQRAMRAGKAERWMYVSGAAVEDPADGGAQPKPGPVSSWRRQQFEAPTDWLFYSDRITRLLGQTGDRGAEAVAPAVRGALLDWLGILNDYAVTRTASVEGAVDWITEAHELRTLIEATLIGYDGHGPVDRADGDAEEFLRGAGSVVAQLGGEGGLGRRIKLSDGEVERLVAQVRALREQPAGGWPTGDKLGLSEISDRLSRDRAADEPQDRYPTGRMWRSEEVPGNVFRAVSNFRQETGAVTAALAADKIPGKGTLPRLLADAAKAIRQLRDLRTRLEAARSGEHGELAGPTLAELTRVEDGLREAYRELGDRLVEQAGSLTGESAMPAQRQLGQVTAAIDRIRSYREVAEFDPHAEVAVAARQLEAAQARLAAAGPAAGARRPGKSQGTRTAPASSAAGVSGDGALVAGLEFAAGAHRVAPADPGSELAQRGYGWLPQVNAMRGVDFEAATNCVIAAIAVDLSLISGDPHQAPPSSAAPRLHLSNYADGRPLVSVADFATISDALEQAGPGARGLVVVHQPGSAYAHAFNAVRDHHGVAFLDGSTGDFAVLPSGPLSIEFLALTPETAAALGSGLVESGTADEVLVSGFTAPDTGETGTTAEVEAKADAATPPAAPIPPVPETAAADAKPPAPDPVQALPYLRDGRALGAAEVHRVDDIEGLKTATRTLVARFGRAEGLDAVLRAVAGETDGHGDLASVLAGGGRFPITVAGRPHELRIVATLSDLAPEAAPPGSDGGKVKIDKHAVTTGTAEIAKTVHAGTDASVNAGLTDPASGQVFGLGVTLQGTVRRFIRAVSASKAFAVHRQSRAEVGAARYRAEVAYTIELAGLDGRVLGAADFRTTARLHVPELTAPATPRPAPADAEKALTSATVPRMHHVEAAVAPDLWELAERVLPRGLFKIGSASRAELIRTLSARGIEANFEELVGGLRIPALWNEETARAYGPITIRATADGFDVVGRADAKQIVLRDSAQVTITTEHSGAAVSTGAVAVQGGMIGGLGDSPVPVRATAEIAVSGRREQAALGGGSGGRRRAVVYSGETELREYPVKWRIETPDGPYEQTVAVSRVYLRAAVEAMHPPAVPKTVAANSRLHTESFGDATVRDIENLGAALDGIDRLLTAFPGFVGDGVAAAGSLGSLAALLQARKDHQSLRTALSVPALRAFADTLVDTGITVNLKHYGVFTNEHVTVTLTARRTRVEHTGESTTVSTRQTDTQADRATQHLQISRDVSAGIGAGFGRLSKAPHEIASAGAGLDLRAGTSSTDRMVSGPQYGQQSLSAGPTGGGSKVTADEFAVTVEFEAEVSSFTRLNQTSRAATLGLVGASPRRWATFGADGAPTVVTERPARPVPLGEGRMRLWLSRVWADANQVHEASTHQLGPVRDRIGAATAPRDPLLPARMHLVGVAPMARLRDEALSLLAGLPGGDALTLPGSAGRETVDSFFSPEYAEARLPALTAGGNSTGPLTAAGVFANELGTLSVAFRPTGYTATAAREWELESSAAGVYPLSSTATTSSFIGARAAGALGHRDGAYAGAAAAGLGARAVTGRTSTETRSGAIDRNVAQKGGDVVLLRVSGDWHLDAGTTWTGSGDFLTGRGTRRGKIVPMTDAMVIAVPVRDVRLANDQIRAHNAGRPVAGHLPLLATDEWLDGNFPLKGSLHVEDPDPAAAPAWHPPVGGDLGRAFPDDLADPGLYELVSGELTALGLIPADPLADEFGNTTRLRRLLGRAGLTSFVDSLLGNGAQARLYRRSGVAWTFGLFKSTTGAEVTVRGRLDGFRLTEITDEKTEVEYHANTAVTSSTATTTAAVLEASAAYGPGGNPSLARPPEPGSAHAGTMAPAPTAGHTHQWSATRTEGVTLSDERVVTSTGPLVQYTARLTLTVETPDGPPRHRTVPIRLRIPESATRTLPPRPAPPAPAPVPLRLAETRLDTPGGLRAWQRSGTKLPAEAVVTSFPGAQQAEEAARAALNAHIRASAEADFITHPLTGGRSTIPSAVHDLSSPEYSKSNYTTIAGDGIGSALTGPSTFPRFRVTLNRHARLGRPALARIVTDDKMERPRQTGVLHDTATAESSSSGVRLDLRTATAALETLPQQGIAAPGRLGPETAGAATTKSQYVTGSNTKRAGGRTMVFTIEVEERYVVRAHGDPDGPGTGTRAVLPPIEVQLPEEVARAAGWLDVADGGARQSAAARHRDESLRAQLGETVQAWQDVLPQRAGWLKAAAAHRAGEAEAGTALQAQRAYHAARADAERASDQLADTIAGRSANPAPAPAPAVPGVPGAQRLLGVSGAGPATEIAKSARPVPAGLLLLDRQDSAVSAAAAAVPARPGSLTLFVHGTDGRIEAGGRRYTAADLAAFLRAGTDWTGGPIVLVSCRTGTAAFAGELSRLLGVPVTAPDGLAWVTADGRAFATETEIGPDGRMRPRVPPTGQWRTFTDGEPGTDQGAYLGTADGPADQLSTAERWGLPDRPFDRRPILAEPAYATNAGDFELNLGSFLYQYEPAVVAARKTADRLLDVLTRQLGSRSRALRAFVKDDPGSAGQVGTGRTDEQIATLLRTGNHREVMTAVYNAAYYANEKSAPGHPHTLKQVIHDLFRAPDAEQQMRALGLDHEKLLAYRDFLDGAGRRAAYATMALGNRKQADRMLANDIFALGSLTLHGGNPLDDTWELGNSQKGRAERDAAAKAHTQPEPAAFARRGAPLSEAELAAASIPVPTGEQIRERVPFWRHDPLRPGEDPAVLLDVLSTGPDAPDLDVRYGPDDRIQAIDVIVTRAETVDPRLSDLPPDEEVTDPATGRVTRLRYQGPEFPVTWRSGRAYYRLPSTSAWYRAKGGTAGMPLVAGVSGTTARLMSVFGWLNVPGVRPEDFLLATAGWMLTSEDHSLYEILRGGEIAGIRAIEHPADSLESVDLYRALDTLGVPVDLLRGKAGLSIELPHLQHEVAAAAVRRQAAAAGISVNDLLEQLGLPRPRRESDAQWPLHPRDVEVWKEIFPAAVTERHRSPVILHSLLPHEATYLQRVAGHGAAPFLAVDRDPASRDLKRALQLHSQLFVAADDEANAETEMLVWLADNGVRADNLLFYLSPAHFVALRLYTGSNHSLLNAVLERGGAFTLRAKLNEYTAMIIEGSNAELPSALTDDPALSRAIFDHKSAVTDNNARRASRAAKAIRKRIAELKTPLYEEMRTHADLVVEALQLLPPVPSGRVFRGDWKIGALSGPASLAGGMSRTYGTDEITFGTLASTSRDEDNAIGFMENTENSYTRHRLLAELELAAHSARDISIFSAHPSEAEVLLLPGARFRVESITRPDGEHERIRAREIEPVGLARATRRPRQLIHGPDVVDLTMWPPATPPAPPSPAPSSFWGGSEPDDDGLPPFVLGPDDDADGPDVPDDILAEEDLLI